MAPTLALATGNTLTLRPYQEEALAKSVAAEERGVRRQLGVMATGLGKTVVFVSKAERRGTRCLILAHRDELISQAVDKVRQWWPDADVGIDQGPRHEVDADVVVASVQSLHAKRLARISPHHFDGGLVVVDEAHHAAAVTYRAILDHFGCGPDSERRRADGPVLFGVTATADRGDGKGLDDLFDEVVFNNDILWGIRSGFLSDLRGVQVLMSDLDLSGVKVRGGDYNEGQLGDALEAADAPEHVVASWLEHALTRRTIVFLPTIALAEETAAEFVASGVNAECVSGVPMEERRAILRRFKHGQTQVVTNCAVLTEGFDEPAVDCIVVARPTKSRALYAQMVGRGTRKFPGKADCLVLDVVGAANEHDLASIPSLFGIEKKEGFFGGEVTVLEAMDEQEEQQRRAGVLIAREVELFHRLREKNQVTWVKAGSGNFAASAGDDTIVLVPGSVEDSWTVRALARNVAPRTLMADVDLELAQGIGDDYVRRARPALLSDPGAAWRKRKPTPKAIAAAQKWGVKVEKGMTAGQVSEAIDSAVAVRRLRDYERAIKSAAVAPISSPAIEPF
jgi:ATP-dependent helicase IRC3